MGRRGVQLVSCAGLMMALWMSLGAGLAQATPVRLLGSYEEYMKTQCASGTSCTVYFSLLSAQTRITKVSCYISFDSGTAGIGRLSLGLGNVGHSSFAEWQYLAPYQYTDFSNVSAYQFLADTDHVYDTGTVPAVNVAISEKTSGSLACSITGYNK